MPFVYCEVIVVVDIVSAVMMFISRWPTNTQPLRGTPLITYINLSAEFFTIFEISFSHDVFGHVDCGLCDLGVI